MTRPDVVTLAAYITVIFLLLCVLYYGVRWALERFGVPVPAWMPRLNEPRPPGRHAAPKRPVKTAGGAE